MRRPLFMLAALAALTLAGCTSLTGKVPGPNDQTSNEAIAIGLAGDTGALGCTFATIKVQPDQLNKIHLGITAARTLLSSEAPSVTELGKVLVVAGVPEQYSRIVAVVIVRIKARLGQSDAIPTNTVAFAMARAFIDACDLSLPGPAAGPLLGPPQ